MFESIENWFAPITFITMTGGSMIAFWKLAISPMKKKLSLIEDLQPLRDEIKKLKKQLDEANDVYVDIIRDRIVQMYDYVSSKGYIDQMRLSSLAKLYEDYTKRGGNHFVSTIVEYMMALPIRREGQEIDK